MRTSNTCIYEGGDCALEESMQLTPVAKLQGEIATANILDGNSVEADYTCIPSAVHTILVVASVGISDSKDSNNYKVIFRDMSNWQTTKAEGIEFAASKIILDEANDRIMGAHILSPHAEEAINIFALMMRLKLKASDLQKMIFTYPTACSDIQYML